MTLTERVLTFYRAAVRRTGSYTAARQAFISRFGLTAARVDRILAAGERN